MATTSPDDLVLVKYYLDKFEQHDIKTYTSDMSGGNMAPVIMAVLRLYVTLASYSPYFRIKVIEVCEATRGAPTSCPKILDTVFTKHVYTRRGEFESRYPSISQMLTLALFSREDNGMTNMSVKSTE